MKPRLKSWVMTALFAGILLTGVAGCSSTASIHPLDKVGLLLILAALLVPVVVFVVGRMGETDGGEGE